MEIIVDRSARILEMDADDEGIRLIASRSRGTPRVANRLLKRTRDYALVKADNKVNGLVAKAALDQLNVDALGLDRSDHRLLTTIIDKFSGGPVGLDTLAASLNEDPDTIMDVLEPFLLQLGFLERTSRGRVATRRAHDHFGKSYSLSDISDPIRFEGF